MLIDTSIFLEFELGQKRAKESEEFLRQVDKGKIEAFTTDFIVDSVLIKMQSSRLANKKLLTFLLGLASAKGLTIFSHDFFDRIAAVVTMIKSRLDFDDAMILVAMKALGIDKIVSFDKHFDRISGIKRIEPKDVV